MSDLPATLRQTLAIRLTASHTVACSSGASEPHSFRFRYLPTSLPASDRLVHDQELSCAHRGRTILKSDALPAACATMALLELMVSGLGGGRVLLQGVMEQRQEGDAGGVRAQRARAHGHG